MTTFNITKNHINRGIRDHQSSCPIALCIKERFPLYFGDTVRIGNKMIHSAIPLNEWAKEKDIEDYELSTGIQKWINRFDTKYPVDEITICAKYDYLFIEGEE